MSTDSTLNLVKTVVAPAKPKVSKKVAAKREEPPKATTVEEAARDVAEAIGGDVQKTESELLAKLLKRTPDAADVSINELISGMQIDGRGDTKSRTEHPKTRSQFVRKSVGEHQQRQWRGGETEGGRGEGEQQRERFQRRAPARPVDAANV